MIKATHLMPIGFMVLAYLIPFSIKAQDTTSYSEPFTLSFYGRIAIPGTDFKQAIEKSMGVGFGITTLFNVNPKDKAPSPFAVGFDASYLSFGRDKVEANQTAPPYKTAFNFWSINGVARVLLVKKPQGIVPFIDGMFGLNIFSTRTKIDKDVFQYIIGDREEEVIGVKNYTGLGYGAGMGWYIRNTRGTPTFSGRVTYLWGEEIKYIERGSVKVDTNGFLTFNTGHANTNMILFQIGITIY